MKVQLKRRSAHAGLTLLEVVLAMSILALGMSAVIGIFSSAASLGVSARQRAQSAAALEHVVSELAERLFPLEKDGTVGEPPLITREPIPGHAPMTYSARATLLEESSTPGVPSLYRVDVSVQWAEKGRERVIEHHMLLPRAVSMGDRLRRELFHVEALTATALPEATSGTDRTNSPIAAGNLERKP